MPENVCVEDGGRQARRMADLIISPEPWRELSENGIPARFHVAIVQFSGRFKAGAPKAR